MRLAAARGDNARDDRPLAPPARGRSAAEDFSMRTLKVWLVLAGALLASACGYNQFQQQDETVKAAWSEVVNQYQRRADLVPYLVNTVKGYAAQEQKVSC